MSVTGDSRAAEAQPRVGNNSSESDCESGTCEDMSIVSHSTSDVPPQVVENKVLYGCDSFHTDPIAYWGEESTNKRLIIPGPMSELPAQVAHFSIQSPRSSPVESQDVPCTDCASRTTSDNFIPELGETSEIVQLAEES